MAFTVINIEETGEHRWAVVRCSCNLADEQDALVGHTVEALRTAYGENALLERVLQEPDPLVVQRFDTEAIRRAFRRGLPDPKKEGNKPGHLTNYRSEPAEMLAKGALEEAFAMEFPIEPQRGKPNANMPVLGFDHWGIVLRGGHYAFVLVQVKGTEEAAVPPQVANTLAVECKRVPTQVDEICRALSIIAIAIGNDDGVIGNAVLGMLQQLGNDEIPILIVSPVIIRGGTTQSQIEDLVPCRNAACDFAPAAGWGVTISIGVRLSEFGNRVMVKARAA